jgi:hypothetical protein
VTKAMSRQIVGLNRIMVHIIVAVIVCFNGNGSLAASPR